MSEEKKFLGNGLYRNGQLIKSAHAASMASLGLTREDMLESLIHDALDVVGVDWEDPNFAETPERIARAWLHEWFSGYNDNLSDLLKVFPNNGQEKDLVVVKDIPFYSHCAHHGAPFFGKAAVAYIPGEYVLGLSKFARIIQSLSRKFELQERLTTTIADTLMDSMAPKGVMIVLSDVTHLCMVSRGIESHGSNTSTSAVRGVFMDNPAARMEALQLMRP